MPIHPDDLPGEYEFFDGSDVADNSGPVAAVEHDPSHFRRSVMMPSTRGRNMPDLNAVLGDLDQLNINGVGVDQIAGLCHEYLKERERVYNEGILLTPEGPRVYGIEALVVFGLKNIITSSLTLRDPEWRNAVDKQTRYYQSNDPAGDPGDPSSEDEQEAEYNLP